MFAKSSAFVDSWLASLQVKSVVQATFSSASQDHKKHIACSVSPSTKAQSIRVPSGSERSSLSKVQFLVGRVSEVHKVPESAKLYEETIDLGPFGTRNILSGLQEHVSEEAFQGRLVVVAANLEPRKLAGKLSSGMVLCASNAKDPRAVELLHVPPDVPLGERIVFEGHEGEPEPVLKKKLAKHWIEVAKDLHTTEEGTVCWQGLPFRTSKGLVTANIQRGVVS